MTKKAFLRRAACTSTFLFTTAAAAQTGSAAAPSAPGRMIYLTEGLN